MNEVPQVYYARIGSSIGNHPDATVGNFPDGFHPIIPIGRRIGRVGYCPMWTDMFLSDGLRPAKESLGALRVGPRQPRRLSERSTRSTTVARNARTSGLSRNRRRSRRACIPGAFPEPLSATASRMGGIPNGPQVLLAAQRRVRLRRDRDEGRNGQASRTATAPI